MAARWSAFFRLGSDAGAVGIATSLEDDADASTGVLPVGAVPAPFISNGGAGAGSDEDEARASKCRDGGGTLSAEGIAGAMKLADGAGDVPCWQALR